jgi:hypothetical protein
MPLLIAKKSLTWPENDATYGLYSIYSIFYLVLALVMGLGANEIFKGHSQEQSCPKNENNK